MKSGPKIVCIILNTNRKDDTLACLGSLAAGSYDNYRAIVLDNASVDGSVEHIRSQFPEVTVFKLETNRGYAGNNNVGIRLAMEAGADWVFVLNEDTVLDRDCLARLAAVGESDAAVGIVGPMVYHDTDGKIIQSAGGKIGRFWRSVHLGQNEFDVKQFDTPHPVDWIVGCGIMVRRGVIDDIGGIDERYFYYWEEIEWCLRAGRAGWRILHVPQARMWHKGVQVDYRPSPSVTYYNTRNRLLTMQKHQAALTDWIGVGVELARTFLSWSIRPKWRSKRRHRYAMYRGAADFIRRRWGGPVKI